MWRSPFKLYLYPDQISAELNPSSVKNILQELAFIDDEISGNRYSTGDKFVSLLTFMGCSPNIELEPQTDKPYCYIEIDTHDKPKFYSGINTKPAMCPSCKTKITTIANPEELQMSCQNCNKQLSINNLNWRRSAFIARTCIAIGNIYESEAIPNDQLLDALKSLSQVPWKYAYIREQQTEHHTFAPKETS